MNKQTDEALRIAIAFMETLTIDVGIKTWNEKHRKEAINACKEALNQPAQEPVAWLWKGKSESIGTYAALAPIDDDDHYSIPLYTHHHQWQGLTDDEIHNIADYSFPFPSEMFAEIFAFARAIEQALKEKNYG